jgi:hypothetical protein
MTLISSVGIPSDICLCGHYGDDHQPECIVVECDVECTCKCFVPDEDDGGYWFTTDSADPGGSR